MRKLRKTLNGGSGDPAVDAALRPLASLFEEAARHLKHREHCRDIEEHLDTLGEHALALVPEHIAAGADSAAARRQFSAALPGFRAAVAAGDPLAARNGPSCTDCHLCESITARFGAWIEARERDGHG